MRQFQNNNACLFFLLVLAIPLHGQISSTDIDLIEKHDTEFVHREGHQHQITFLFSNHESTIVKYNPVSLILGSLMWTYQKLISPQLSSTCLYSPSCSSYSKNLLSEFGILKGLLFTADRLTRCNRLALMDFNSWEADSKIGKIRESTDYYRLNE